MLPGVGSGAWDRCGKRFVAVKNEWPHGQWKAVKTNSGVNLLTRWTSLGYTSVDWHLGQAAGE